MKRKESFSLIEQFTGQTAVYSEIIHNVYDKKYLITAPAGQGKHYLVSKMVTALGKKIHSCVFNISTRNSALEKGQDFAPFMAALSEIESITHINLVKLGSSVTEILPYIGKLSSKILAVKKTYPAVFSNTEIEILLRFERITSNKDTVFICEEIDNWDQASIRLLKKLFYHSNELTFGRMCFICTSSSDDIAFSQLELDKCLSLERIPEKSIHDVIKTLQPEHTYGSEMVDKISYLSCGNIGIIIHMLRLVSENGTDFIDTSREYRDITLRRLRAVLSVARFRQVEELLDRASLIGEHIYRMLLIAFTKYDPVSFSCSVTDAVIYDILTESTDTISFNSNLVWRVFNAENTKNQQYHYELSNCLKALMPSNYSYISNELLFAGQEQEAAIYCILSALCDYYTYRIQPDLSDSQISLMKRHSLYETYKQLTQLYSHYFTNDFSSALQMEAYTKHNLLRFESDYICALAHVNGSIKLSAYKQAATMMESWIEDDGFRAESPYQWMRAVLLVLSIKYESHDQSMHELVKQLEKTKRKYIPSDRGIERLEYDFLSKCNYCYTVDTAYHYTKRAVEYFKRQLNQSPSMYPYYTALINSAANALVMGKYHEAIQFSLDALSLTEDICPLYGAADALVNNLFIAGILSGQVVSPDEINIGIAQLRRFLDTSAEDVLSQTLIRNNIAIMLCYSGDFLSASLEIKQLYNELQYIDDVDDYYRYIVGSNDCVLEYILGNGIFNSKRFQELCVLHPLDHDHSYFVARNHYLLEQISARVKVDTTEVAWNDFSVQRVGDGWSFWGKWLLFSDMQIWNS